MIYVQIRPKGTRLGNWMFQYAAAKSEFPGTEIAFVIEDHNDWAKVEKFRSLFPDVVITDYVPSEKELRTGLYQDVKFLSPNICGKLYICPIEVQESLERKFSNILQNDKLVSIHVRRGDYLKLPHRHPFVGESYLEDAVDRFANIPDIEFMVCSDDISWCKKFFASKCFSNFCFHFSEGCSVLEDLFLMRNCKGGHICSNSTFSWWGAYAGSLYQPLTIFPSMWYGPAVHEEWKGLYFNGSIVIKNNYSLLNKFSVYAHLMKDAAGRLLRKTGLR